MVSRQNLCADDQFDLEPEHHRFDRFVDRGPWGVFGEIGDLHAHPQAVGEVIVRHLPDRDRVVCVVAHGGLGGCRRVLRPGRRLRFLGRRGRRSIRMGARGTSRGYGQGRPLGRNREAVDFVALGPEARVQVSPTASALTLYQEIDPPLASIYRSPRDRNSPRGRGGAVCGISCSFHSPTAPATGFLTRCEFAFEPACRGRGAERDVRVTGEERLADFHVGERPASRWGRDRDF
jgi:hypothetical protein